MAMPARTPLTKKQLPGVAEELGKRLSAEVTRRNVVREVAEQVAVGLYGSEREALGKFLQDVGYELRHPREPFRWQP